MSFFKTAITGFLFFLSANSFALMDLDSLKDVLKHTQPDSASFQEYLSFFSRKGDDQREAKIIVANWLIISANSVENYEVVAKSYHFLGHLATYEQRFADATNYFNTALEIAEKYEIYDVMARVYNSYGMMYYDFNQLEYSAENYKKAVEFAQKSEKKKGLSIYYFNLAGMYFEMAEENLDTVKMAINIAKSAEKIQWNDKDTFGLITTKNGLALMYLRLNLPDSSLKELEENTQLIKLTGLENKYPVHFVRLGEVYVYMKEYSTAISYLDQGMQYVHKFDDTRWEYVYYKWYSKAYAGLSNYKLAYEYNVRYQDLHDSIMTQKNYFLTDEIRTRYETEKKEKEINRLNEENSAKQLKLEQEASTKLVLKIIIYSGLVVLCVLTFLAIFLVKLSRTRKKFNLELEHRNLEIQKQSLILNEQSKVITRFQSQMNPHFIFNALQGIQGLVINDDKSKTLKQLQLLSQLMRDTLNNSENESITLEVEFNYLKRYVEFEQAKFQNKIEFEILSSEINNDILIPPMLIQPFIENSIKHARLHEVVNPKITLEVLVGTDSFRISLMDNGCGFDMHATKIIQESHAVAMISSRLNLLWQIENEKAPENIFSLTSLPQLACGTRVEFYLPLKYKF